MDDQEKALKQIREAVSRGRKVLTDAQIMGVIVEEIGSVDLVREAIAETEPEDGTPQQEYVSTGGTPPSRQIRPVYEQSQEPQLAPPPKSIVKGIKK